MKTKVFKRAAMLTASAAIIAGGYVLYLKHGNISGETETADTLFRVQPPIPELEPPFKIFTVQAEKGDTLYLPEGTRITIPPNALVDTNGNPVSGEATVKYREFHNMTSVFLSGIPMEVRENGQKRIFQTAGMFEIRAENENGELQLADGKSIAMDFASYETGDDYDFFAFDENGSGWQVQEADVSPRENPVKKTMSEKIKKLKQKLTKKPFDKRYFVFNYNALIDIVYADDWSEMYKQRRQANSQKQTEKPLLHKAERYGISVYDWPGSWMDDAVTYKGNVYPVDFILWKKISQRQINKLDEKKCHEIYKNLEKTGKDIYKFSKQCIIVWLKDTRTITEITATPVMPLKYLFRYPPEHWISNRQQIEREIEKEEALLAQQTDVVRYLEIMRFGIFNCDKFLIEDRAKRVVASLKFINAKPENNVMPPQMVMISIKDKWVVRNGIQDGNTKFTLFNDPGVRMFCVLPDKKIAVLPEGSYNAMLKKIYRENNDDIPELTLEMEILPDVINSEDDIKKALKI